MLKVFLCWKKKKLKGKLNTGALLPTSLQNACYCQFYETEKLNLLHKVLCVFFLNILKYNSELFSLYFETIAELTLQTLLQANGNLTGLDMPLGFCFIIVHGLFIIVFFISGEARYETYYPNNYCYLNNLIQI